MNLEDNPDIRDYNKLKEIIPVTLTLSGDYNRIMGHPSHQVHGPKPFGTGTAKTSAM